MSRKTKKEKIAAEQRRNATFSYQISSSQHPETNHGANEHVRKYSIPVNDIHDDVAVTSKNEYSYVSSDLKRISLLTLLAFCAQVVLWYFLGRW